jgi:two-component system sensor histidine kinase KdpD
MSSISGGAPERPAGRAGSPEPYERLLVPSGRSRLIAGLAAAVAGPAVVTILASLPPHRLSVVAALLYLLAVVVAAAIGHLWPGLLAAALSFFGLDYFFTPPLHTFVVGKAEDLVALAVFLLVAAVVSAALSAALEQRATAEFRESQVRALYHVTSRLLSGAGLDSVLSDLAVALRSLYGLRGVRVVVTDRGGVDRERAITGAGAGIPEVSLPLAADGRTVGRIELYGSFPGGTGGSEAEVLAAFSGQLALALERARLGEEAAEAQLEAEASRIRAALFSSVTHDLRTPLASIVASASSLLEKGVPFSEEQREELLRTILEEGERLNRLVANLMDLSRLRAGALVPEVQPVPLEDVVASVLRRLRPQLGRGRVEVLIRDDVPAVAMDVVQMDQAFTNLIENAIRYSPADQPDIRISAARWHNAVEIRVADRGPGIAEAERARVFQEFYRRDVGGRRGGSGLGLTIAQAIVAAHGGSMWIEDTPGGGTTVGFRLPLDRSLGGAREAEPEPAPPPPAEAESRIEALPASEDTGARP